MLSPDGEILVKPPIQVERPRTAVRVAPENAISPQGVHCEGRLVQVLRDHRSVAAIGKIRRNAGKVGALAALARAGVVLPADHGERKAAAPRDDRCHVPPADEEVSQVIGGLHRQGPDAREVEHVRKVVVGRSAVVGLVVGVGDVGAVGFVRRAHVVVDRLGICIVGEDSETLAEALLGGKLKRVIDGLTGRFHQDNLAQPGGVKRTALIGGGGSRRGIRVGRVEVPAARQGRPLGAGVRRPRQPAAADLPLERQVPGLHVRVA